MKWTAIVLMVALAAPGLAEARGKRGNSGPRYDASQDFSKHFDDEVKYDREHPKADDDDGAQAPKRRKSHKRKKRASQDDAAP